MERLEILRAIRGSYNYNLNDSRSDLDIMKFVMPTFEDLLSRTMYTKHDTTSTANVDTTITDIRMLPHLLWESNLATLEVLFSSSITKNFPLITLNSADDMIPIMELRDLLDKIFSMKNELSVMNLPYLYDSIHGMFHTLKKAMNHGFMGTELICKYDVLKNAMNAYRVLDAGIKFANTNFTDFNSSIRYEEKSVDHMFLMSIKNDRWTLSALQELMDSKLMKFEACKDLYKSHEPHPETKEELIFIINSIIRIIIRKELYI